MSGAQPQPMNSDEDEQLRQMRAAEEGAPTASVSTETPTPTTAEIGSDDEQIGELALNEQEKAVFHLCANGVAEYLIFLSNLESTVGRVTDRDDQFIERMVSSEIVKALTELSFKSKIREARYNPFRMLLDKVQTQEHRLLRKNERQSINRRIKDWCDELVQRKKNEASRQKAAYSDDSLADRFVSEKAEEIHQNRATGKIEVWCDPLEKWVTKDNDIQKELRNFKDKITLSESSEVGDLVRFRSARTSTALLQQVKSSTHLREQDPILDMNPDIIGLPNGLMVNLRTGEIRPCRPHDYLTMRTSVLPREGDCSAYLEFLRQITVGDQQYQDYLEFLSGYCMTGSTQQQNLYIALGNGRNGKGVWVGLHRDILGPDYFLKADNRILSNNPGHSTGIADLHLRRMSIFDELSNEVPMSGLIKDVTGDDEMRARRMREDYAPITLHSKIFILANDAPSFDGSSNAIAGRLRVLPFRFNERHDQMLDPTLRGKLSQSSGAVFWRWLKLAEQYLRDCEPLSPSGGGAFIPGQFAACSEVERASKRYLKDHDPLSEFLRDCRIDHTAPFIPVDEHIPIEWSSGRGASQKQLVEEYRKFFVEETGQRTVAISSQKFRELMEIRGYRFAKQQKKHANYCYNLILSKRLRIAFEIPGTADYDERTSDEVAVQNVADTRLMLMHEDIVYMDYPALINLMRRFIKEDGEDTVPSTLVIKQYIYKAETRLAEIRQSFKRLSSANYRAVFSGFSEPEAQIEEMHLLSSKYETEWLEKTIPDLRSRLAAMESTWNSDEARR